MYYWLVSAYLIWLTKDMVAKLIGLEGGLSAFKTVHWVMAAMCVIMPATAVYTAIKGFRTMRKKEDTPEETEEPDPGASDGDEPPVTDDRDKYLS